MGSQENEAPPQTHDGALCGIDEFLKHTYSYLIVGGGTAGLVLANRLSEVTNVTVGVLEAGPAKLNDPMILMPGLATQGMYSPDTNWLMKSVPQVCCFIPHYPFRQLIHRRFMGVTGLMTFLVVKCSAALVQSTT